MSRRHPLSSPKPELKSVWKQTLFGSYDFAGIKLPAIPKRTYFFFLATLRVFFAVFFTALFVFFTFFVFAFAFFAFLAMLPSRCSEMA